MLKSISLNLPEAKLEYLESGGKVQLTNNELLGHGANSVSVTLHLEKPLLTKINKAIRLGKGIRLDGEHIKVDHELYEDGGDLNFRKLGRDVNRGFNRYAPTVGKTMARIGLPVASEAIGTMVGAYTGNPILGHLTSSTMNELGTRGINQIPGGKLSVKKIGRQINKALNSNTGKAMRRGLKSAYQESAPILGQMAHQAVLEHTGDAHLASMANSAVNRAAHGSVKDFAGHTTRDFLNHGTSELLANGHDSAALLTHSLGNNMLAENGYGFKQVLHRSTNFKNNLYLNGNPDLKGLKPTQSLFDKGGIPKSVKGGSFRGGSFRGNKL